MPTNFFRPPHLPGIVQAQDDWYLQLGAPDESANNRRLFDPASKVLVGLLSFLTFVILYSPLIPISLYVSIDMIKYFQVGSESAHARALGP